MWVAMAVFIAPQTSCSQIRSVIIRGFICILDALISVRRSESDTYKCSSKVIYQTWTADSETSRSISFSFESFRSKRWRKVIQKAPLTSHRRAFFIFKRKHLFTDFHLSHSFRFLKVTLKSSLRSLRRGFRSDGRPSVALGTKSCCRVAPPRWAWCCCCCFRSAWVNWLSPLKFAPQHFQRWSCNNRTR